VQGDSAEAASPAPLLSSEVRDRFLTADDLSISRSCAVALTPAAARASGEWPRASSISFWAEVPVIPDDASAFPAGDDYGATLNAADAEAQLRARNLRE